MKRITVGRGNDCDIVIIDETDNVSRHHIVITFNFFGKMKVSDTSSNGTSINGTRMLKGTSIPVTREDNIRLGRNIELDWNFVKDPYKPIRIATISIFSALVLIVFGTWLFMWFKEQHKPTESVRIEMIRAGMEVDDNWNKDSTAKVAPTITSIDVNDKKKASSKDTNRKKKEVKKINNHKEKANKYIETTNNSELDSIAVL